ncbi:MAG: hypothetical protein IPK50_11160 [Fibrobacterota bacterium]|nr:hypothetical protein [Fibrobacterota bacterium]QQS07436.1 MAG: hypothetical protein IPK50_11160 [Fibrobacterota bacterium]
MEIRSDLAGFRAAEQSMAKRSERIAKATLDAVGTPDGQAASQATGSTSSVPSALAPQSPDFVSDVVGMTTDRLAGSYDIKAMKVRDRMMGELLDLIR